MPPFIEDLRYAFRIFVKDPGPMLIAIFALTLGIGANSAIFSVVNAVLLKPLTYREPDRLMILWEANPSKNIREFYVSPPNFRDWLEQNRSFESMAAIRPHPSILTGGALPERLDGTSVSPSVFEMLGARAMLGRTFLAGEDRPGKDQVVVLSYGLWQRRFGGDRSILGKSLVLDGSPHLVVGITAPDFRLFDAESELWVPYVLDAKELQQRGFHTLKVVARLRSGVSLEQGSEEMRRIARGLEQQYPDTNLGWTVDPVLARDQMVGNIRATLLTLVGAVCFVLLIACSNVAILLLTRASGRQKEIAIRSALGASRSRIIRQMLTESVMLSVVSGVLGLLLAYVGIFVLVALKPANIPRMAEIRLDWRVIFFTFGVCVVTGLLFGMLPAISATKSRLNEILRIAGRTAMASVQARRTRGLLVVSEIALSVALLIAAGLLIRTFAELQSVDPGFRPAQLLTLEVALPESRYQGRKVAHFHEQLIERIQRLPGVHFAAVARNIPMSGGDPSLNFVVEHRPTLPSAEQPRAKYRAISADYFTALGIPLIKGRYFKASDGESAPNVVIINDALAHRLWPNEDPLGQRIRPGFDNSAWCTIVGVVGNVRYAGLGAEANAETYYPYLQVPAQLMNFVEGSMTVVVKTAGDPLRLTSAVRKEVQSLDPDQPVFHVTTMENVIHGSVAQPRFRAILLGAFAGVALLLAAIGLYGVISYSVSQRTSEMGIRAALGAGKSDLARLVMGEGARLAIAGALLGLLLAFALTRTLSSLLYGVKAADPVTFASTALLLMGVALVAVYIPARRASRVDPVIAMKT